MIKVNSTMEDTFIANPDGAASTIKLAPANVSSSAKGYVEQASMKYSVDRIENP
jgi:hypothetical protein